MGDYWQIHLPQNSTAKNFLPRVRRFGDRMQCVATQRCCTLHGTHRAGDYSFPTPSQSSAYNSCPRVLLRLALVLVP